MVAEGFVKGHRNELRGSLNWAQVRRRTLPNGNAQRSDLSMQNSPELTARSRLVRGVPKKFTLLRSSFVFSEILRLLSAIDSMCSIGPVSAYPCSKRVRVCNTRLTEFKNRARS